jgi:hypothetical protein
LKKSRLIFYCIFYFCLVGLIFQYNLLHLSDQLFYLFCFSNCFFIFPLYHSQNLFLISTKEIILFLILGTVGLFLGSFLNYPTYGNLIMISYATASVFLFRGLRTKVKHMLLQSVYTFGAIIFPIVVMAIFTFGYILPNAPDSHIPVIILFASIQTMLSSTSMFLRLPKLNVCLVIVGVSLLSWAFLIGSLHFYASFTSEVYLYAQLIGQLSNFFIIIGLLDHSKILKDVIEKH